MKILLEVQLDEKFKDMNGKRIGELCIWIDEDSFMRFYDNNDGEFLFKVNCLEMKKIIQAFDI